MMRKISVFLLLLMLPIHFLFAQESDLKPVEGKALVVVFRVAKTMGWAYSFPFGVDNKVFCVLKNNTYGYVNIDPGEHTIHGSRFLDGSYELTLSQDKSLNLDFNSDHSDQLMGGNIFEAGKTYYYETKIGLGGSSIYCRLEAIDAKKASKYLKKMKLSSNNRPEMFATNKE